MTSAVETQGGPDWHGGPIGRGRPVIPAAKRGASCPVDHPLGSPSLLLGRPAVRRVDSAAWLQLSVVRGAVGGVGAAVADGGVAPARALLVVGARVEAARHAALHAVAGPRHRQPDARLAHGARGARLAGHLREKVYTMVYNEYTLRYYTQPGARLAHGARGARLAGHLRAKGGQGFTMYGIRSRAHLSGLLLGRLARVQPLHAPACPPHDLVDQRPFL
eukprot:1139949-Prorocentrum_minimum.AAC.1